MVYRFGWCGCSECGHKFEDELNSYIEDIKDKALDKLDSIVEKKQVNVVKEIEDLKVNFVKEDVNYEVGDNVKVGVLKKKIKQLISIYMIIEKIKK